MKAVLISIQPKWCELIANGKKTVEVRKTKPKLETPFKVYIYCTKPKTHFRVGCLRYSLDELFKLPTGKITYGSTLELWSDWSEQYDESNFLCGKVIGEFVCDYFYGLCQFGFGVAIYDEQKRIIEPPDFLNWSCLTEQQLIDYIGNGDGYAWHISNLVIYDKPRELSELKKINRDCWYADLGLAKRDCPECQNKDCFIQRPPQSWCYVEELG